MSTKPTYDELVQKVRELELTISELTAQESVLHSDNQRYKYIFEHIWHEIHVWELVRDELGNIKTWRLVDANPVALDAWGKSLAEVVGKTTDEVFPNTNPTDLFMPIVEKIFAEGEPHIWQNYFPATGQTLYMISIPFGEYFISTGTDITQVKKTEKQLKDTLLRLTEAITAGNVGLWDWDLVTNSVYYSKEWKRQIGYNDDEISNDFEEWEKRVHPDDLEEVLKVTNDTINKVIESHETEFRFRHKDGSYRWILAHASIVKDENDKPIRMLGSHVDITRQKQMQIALNQKQKLEAIGTLASGIAHDFNNLLAPILGFAELIKMSFTPNAKEFEYLEQMENLVERAANLIEKILIINRTTLSKSEPVQLKNLVEEVLTVLHASVLKNIDIRQEIDFDLPLIVADSSQLYQMILNLCVNAIQAMPDGGELLIRLNRIKHEGGISVLGQAANEFVCLVVEDNGSGIESDIIKHIYDPFFTTKDKGEERGTGLGLSIVSSIVKQHNGHIEVESELGLGTIFRVYFPVSLENEMVPTKELENSVMSGNEHILLIDDEKMVCDLGRSILTKLGYQVSAYVDGHEALKRFQRNPQDFDLVITDYSMPLLMGPQLIKKIREIREDIPILLLTGYTNLATAESLDKWGCDGVITKPYRMKQINQAIRRVLTTE
ncbi:MAG TPA: ATP-binding protein [Anaerolineae bacterium]|nr:ATP-binding protein [Anaerolineae bacterium]